MTFAIFVLLEIFVIVAVPEVPIVTPCLAHVPVYLVPSDVTLNTVVSPAAEPTLLPVYDTFLSPAAFAPAAFAFNVFFCGINYFEVTVCDPLQGGYFFFIFLMTSHRATSTTANDNKYIISVISI